MGYAPFGLRAKQEADLEAARWGLLAWVSLGVAGWFLLCWAAVRMFNNDVARGEKSTTPTLLALMCGKGARYSGLVPSDETVILKVERRGEAEELCFPKANSVDPLDN